MNKNIHALAHVNNVLTKEQARVASLNSDDLFLPTDGTEVIYDGKTYGGGTSVEWEPIEAGYVYITGNIFTYNDYSYFAEIYTYFTYSNSKETNNNTEVGFSQLDLGNFLSYLENRFVLKTANLSEASANEPITEDPIENVEIV